MRRKPEQPASPELLNHLGQLGEQMMTPFRTDFTKGRLVKRTTAKGWTKTWVFGPYPNSVGLRNIEPRCLRELGAILVEIRQGVDARRLFRQNERKKPSKLGDHQVGAMAYWARFARNPESAANRESAINAARRILPSLENLSDATIKRIAGDHRERVLGALGMRHGISFQITNGKRIKTLGPEKIGALREYLAKKSARPAHR